MDYTILFDRRAIKMIITTTADNVAVRRLANGGVKITLFNPDVASILGQIKTGDMNAAKSKMGSVAEIATANLEAAMSKTFPVTAPKSKPVTLAEITNAVHEAAEALLQKP
jgi:hypothetical protein